MQAGTKEAKRAQQAPARADSGNVPAGPDSGNRNVSDYLDEEGMTDPRAEVEFLLRAGWKRVDASESPNPMKRWLDPRSGKPSKKVMVQPEQRDLAGRLTAKAIWQNEVGVPDWYYTRKEAVQLQRDWDEAKAKGKK
jgi:hypothetical protein